MDQKSENKFHCSSSINVIFVTIHHFLNLQQESSERKALQRLTSNTPYIAFYWCVFAYFTHNLRNNSAQNKFWNLLWAFLNGQDPHHPWQGANNSWWIYSSSLAPFHLLHPSTTSALLYPSFRSPPENKREFIQLRKSNFLFQSKEDEKISQ